jgi:hypothetical protein
MASKYQGPVEDLARYEALVATVPQVERKGATMPYTSRNGHMFSFLDRTGSMGLRLPAELRASFLESYETEIAEQHGRQMKEFVVIPGHLLERTDELREWFDKSYAWIGTLKPKSTERS